MQFHLIDSGGWDALWDRASKTSIHAWRRDTDACDISFLHQIVGILMQP